MGKAGRAGSSKAKSVVALALVAGGAGLLPLACDGGATTMVHGVEPQGQIQLQLVGVSSSGVAYRLRQAIIVVQGPSSTLFLDSDRDPSSTSLGATVPVGSYSAFLQEGWILERLGDSGGKAGLSSARLVSPNPVSFFVGSAATARVPLRFAVGDDTVDVGSFEIVLEVEESAPEAEVCSSDADCREGQTCCIGGFLGTCRRLDSGEGCPLPDLTVSASTAAASLNIGFEAFAATSCALDEGCVDAPGVRRLLRFSTQTANEGENDIILGDPSSTSGFEFAACHGHFHFEGYARYELLDLAGAVAASGHKQAFCLLDSEPVRPGAAERPRFHCGFQGIQSGWSDVYGAGLDCQWVDITDVPAGDYVLRITINPERTLQEANYDNNVAEIPVHIGDALAADALAACPGATPGLQRDCGWSFAEKMQGLVCQPGELLSVGCGGCTTGGTCQGDPMLRVCEGTGACPGFLALAASDDLCSPCPETSFACPPSGVYSVLTGSFDSSLSSLCEPVVTANEPAGLTDPCPQVGPQRDCGWSVSPELAKLGCTPGEQLTLGCGGCATGGTCEGDPLLRVCAGAEPCLASQALASSDDSCSLCPEVLFSCPAEGVYTVMTGAFAGGAAFACQPVTAAPSGPF